MCIKDPWGFRITSEVGPGIVDEFDVPAWAVRPLERKLRKVLSLAKYDKINI